MYEVNHFVDDFFGWNAHTFEGAYVYPEKLFRLLAIEFDRPKKHNIFVLIYLWLVLLNPLLYLIFAWNMSERCADASCYLKLFIGLSSGMNCFVKITPIYYNAKEYIRLRKIANDRFSDCARSGEADERVRAMKYLRAINFVNKYLTIEFCLCGFVFCLVPVILYAFKVQRGAWLLPLETKIFFIDDQSHPGYEIHYLFCTLHIMYLCIGHSAIDLTFFMFGVYVCMELDNCKANCHKIGSGVTEELQDVHLRKCLISYAKGYMFVKDFSRLFSWTFFGENLVTIVALSTSIVASSVESSTFVITLLLQLGSYCLMGQMIVNKSADVCDSIYLSEWHRLIKCTKMARTLGIFLKHAQVRSELSAWRYFQLSFETLAQIMKATCSYVLFLQSFT